VREGQREERWSVGENMQEERPHRQLGSLEQSLICGRGRGGGAVCVSVCLPACVWKRMRESERKRGKKGD